jgi:hypothetical protein
LPVHAGKTLGGVNFDFDAFESHDSAGIDAYKHDRSLDEDEENVNSWKKEIGS